MYFDQHEFDVRCEWGLSGITHLAPVSDVIVIVDVLSFTTCVDIAVGRGALVYPYRRHDETAEAFAAQIGAVLALPRRSATEYSLSAASLSHIPPGTRLVLPSPNGSSLSIAAGAKPVLAGCLRNAEAVALAAQELGPSILVVPAGERWPDSSLRPAIEDLLGAGAVICHLQGRKSPEAAAAETAFLSASANLEVTLRACSSGKELIERGFAEDVVLASQVDTSDCVPLLVDGAYRRREA